MAGWKNDRLEETNLTMLMVDAMIDRGKWHSQVSRNRSSR